MDLYKLSPLNLKQFDYYYQDAEKAYINNITFLHVSGQEVFMIIHLIWTKTWPMPQLDVTMAYTANNHKYFGVAMHDMFNTALWIGFLKSCGLAGRTDTPVGLGPSPASCRPSSPTALSSHSSLAD